MAESATDAMHNENTGHEHANLQEDPFPPVDPFPSVETFSSADPFPPTQSTTSTQASLGQGNIGKASRKRKRVSELGELVSLVSKGLSSMSEACAGVKNLSSAICNLNLDIAETKKRFSCELVALGFDRREVIKAVLKLGNRVDLLEIWSGMDDEMKKEMIMELLNE